MDETEITNSEYKEFVFYVRDSVTRTKLGLMAELSGEPTTDANGNPVEGTGIQKYAFKSADTTGASPYQKYMIENYYDLGEGLDSLKPLNWDEELVWEKKRISRCRICRSNGFIIY